MAAGTSQKEYFHIHPMETEPKFINPEGIFVGYEELVVDKSSLAKLHQFVDRLMHVKYNSGRFTLNRVIYGYETFVIVLVDKNGNKYRLVFSGISIIELSTLLTKLHRDLSYCGTIEQNSRYVSAVCALKLMLSIKSIENGFNIIGEPS